MTQQEYEQKKCECWRIYAGGFDIKDEIPNEAFNWVFDRAYALGKQEKNAEDTVISGWVARDEDENLFMYNTKPERDETIHMWMGECANIDLRNHLFPDLTWESEPQEVEIIIKRKKNG